LEEEINIIMVITVQKERDKKIPMSFKLHLNTSKGKALTVFLCPKTDNSTRKKLSCISSLSSIIRFIIVSIDFTIFCS
jgi:hypothetical protein